MQQIHDENNSKEHAMSQLVLPDGQYPVDVQLLFLLK